MGSVREIKLSQYRQALLAVEAIDPSEPRRATFAAQQDIKTPVAEPAALVRQLAQPVPQGGIRWTARAIPHALAIRADDAAGPPLRDAELLLEARYARALVDGPHHFFPSSSFSIA